MKFLKYSVEYGRFNILFLQCSYSNAGFGKFSLLFSVLFLFWKFSVCVQVLQAVGRGSEVISNRITIALEASLGQIFDSPQDWNKNITRPVWNFIHR